MPYAPDDGLKPGSVWALLAALVGYGVMVGFALAMPVIMLLR